MKHWKGRGMQRNERLIAGSAFKLLSGGDVTQQQVLAQWRDKVYHLFRFSHVARGSVRTREVYSVGIA